MDACVGAPHLSRNLKPTVTIRDWSPQNMTRVRFTRKVEDYALARRGGKGQVGQIRPWCSIGGDGSLSPNSFRAGRTPATEGVGHGRSCRPQTGAAGSPQRMVGPTSATDVRHCAFREIA